MSDLFARIGPKAPSDEFKSSKPVKFFPNKVWVREGFQVKKTSRKSNASGNNTFDHGYDSDSSSKGHDDGHDRDDEVSWEPHGDPYPRPTSPPSLLKRMGMSPTIKLEEVPQTIPKDNPAPNIPAVPGPSRNPKSNPTPLHSQAPVQPRENLEGRAEGGGKLLEEDKNTGQIAPIAEGPLILITNPEMGPSSVSVPNGHNENQPNDIKLKTSTPHGDELNRGGSPGHSGANGISPRVELHKTSQHIDQESRKSNLPTPPLSASNTDISLNNLPAVGEANTSLPSAPQSSSVEGGEQRVDLPSQTKSLLERIVEQNVSRRITDGGSRLQSQPVLVPSSGLAKDLCDSVARSMDQAEKQLQEMLALPQIQSILNAAATAGGFLVPNATLFQPNTQAIPPLSSSPMPPPQPTGQPPQVFDHTSSPRVERAFSPVHIPPEMLAPQESSTHASGRPGSNYMSPSSVSAELGSSAEYEHGRHHYPHHEPYFQRGRGRGRGFFRGRGAGYIPYDNRFEHRRRSLSARRSNSPPPKYSYQRPGRDGPDLSFSRGRSKSRSPGNGKGKGRYRSLSRSKSPGGRRSRSRSPPLPIKSYRSKYDSISALPPPRRRSDYSRSHKYSKRTSRSRSRSQSIASSRSRSPTSEHRRSKKHRLRDKSRSVSPSYKKGSPDKKRRRRTPSPEEARRKRKHSSVSKPRERSQSRPQKRDDHDRTGGSHPEESGRRASAEKAEERKSTDSSRKIGSPPPEAVRSADRTPQATTTNEAPETIQAQEAVRPLPCHNVPGIWSATLGNNTISTFQWVFEIDDITAKKWDIPKPRDTSDPSRPAAPIMQRLAVQICCYLKPEIEALMQNLTPSISPQEVANKISGLRQNWPSTRDLVITINPKLPGKKTWLSYELGPGLDIASYIHQGENIVEFVQLADMSTHMFVLLSSENDIKPVI